MPDGGSWWRLAWGGARWRRGASLMVLGMAALAVAGGAVGPEFARSADDSALVSAVAAAPATTSVHVLGQGGERQWTSLQAAVADPPGGEGAHWFAAPLLQAQAGVSFTAAGQTFGAVALGRNGLCAHLRLSEGRCPSSPTAVAVSRRSAARLGVGPGSGLVLHVPGSTRTERLTVVGVYLLPAVSPTGFWDSGDVFDLGNHPNGAPQQVDALLATTAPVLATAAFGDQPQLSASLASRAQAFHGATPSGVERSLAAFAGRVERGGMDASSGLPGVMAQVASSERTATTVVQVAALQLVGLGLLVVYLVTSSAAQDRREELELAVRRGLTRGQLLVLAAGEPAVMLAVALPVGLALAWLAVRSWAARLFVPGTPVDLPSLSLAAGVATTAVGLVAVVVATSDLRRGSRHLGERASQGRATRAAADALAVAAGGAGLVALAAHGSLGGAGAGGGDPVALVAPALLSLGAGVVGLRIASGVLRVALRTTARTATVSPWLAVRFALRRRPAPLRQVLALTAAVALAVFGVSVWSVARGNRGRVAAVEAGADRVVDVTTPPGTDLATAVDRADPSGRSAMAVELLRSPSGTTVAVQAPRLATVASWPRGLAPMPVGAIARYLAPPTAPPITFSGDTLTAQVALAAGDPALTMTATVFNVIGEDQDTLLFPTIRPGVRTYTADVGGFCQTSCRLVDLSPSLVDPDGPASTVDLDLLGLTASRATASGGGDSGVLRIGVGRPGSWTAQPSGVTATSGRTAVAFSFPAADASSLGLILSPADVPSPMPAVTTAAVLADSAVTAGSSTFDASGLDGNTVEVDVAGGAVASTLPGAGDGAVLVNLAFAQLDQTGPSQAVQQVWLHGAGGTAVVRRLRAAGVAVTGDQRSSTLVAQMDKGALAVAYTLVLATGVVAAGMAAAATGFAFLAGTRRRRRHLRSLLLGGLPVASIRRALTLETTIVLAVSLVIGIGVGWAASDISLRSLPQVTGGPQGVPLGRSVLLDPLLAVVAGLLVVLTVVAAAITVAVVGRRGRQLTEDRR